MKKIITLVPALALTVGLTGCAENNSPAGGISDDTSSLQSSSASQSTTSSQSSVTSQSSTFSESTSFSQIESLSEAPVPVTPLPENAIAPDGSAVDFSEAVSFSQTPQDNYMFDYAFVRLAEGELYTTNEDPSLYDWETNRFTKELSTGEPKYIKVKVGDTLANGLTVTRAVTLFENYPGGEDYAGFIANYVDFGDNDTELTGYLSCEIYTDPGVDQEKKRYMFYADPSQSDPIPISFFKYNYGVGIRVVNEEEKFAAIGDAGVIKLRIPENTEIDLTKIVPNKFIKAKVKVSNMRVYYDPQFNERNSAVLDGLEIL